MATTSKNEVAKKTPLQLKNENDRLHKILDTGCRCPRCGKVKDQETGFYYDTDPMMGGASYSRICRDCAKAIACRRGKDGIEREPTRESVQQALFYLNKPFLESVWNASIQESENLVTGKTKNNVWTSYIKNIQMKNYVGMTYLHSDMYTKKDYVDPTTKVETIDEVLDSHSGQDTYDSFTKNKSDVVRLLDYDPFDKESPSDQPFLYAQLLGLLDSGGSDVNEDMIRTSSAITIARGFLQASKIDDAMAKLMVDITQVEKNSATIKSLQDSKARVMSTIKDLAAESCLSLKNNKNSSKGENSWTGKLKKIEGLNLKAYEINGYDIETCKGMQQVADISTSAILKSLALDETEWSDIVADQTLRIKELEAKEKGFEEASRILLRENLELRDEMKAHNLLNENELLDLNQLVNNYFVGGGINEKTNA